MREFVVPVCQSMFHAHPSAQSITYAVAQYWNDEADHAVHSHFSVSTARNPSWREAHDDHEANFEGTYSWDHRPKDRSELDDNSTMITAFASYCEEEGSQEDEVAEAYTPYALVRRVVLPGSKSDIDVSVEIVGRMFRPEWEDSWHDEEDDE